MTFIPAYAAPENLPAPVTSGSGVQSFTDVWGDVWVAANGVYGGAWRRARDVLYTRVNRFGAMNLTTTQVNITYDNIYRDVYGLWTPGQSGVAIPVTGLYRIHAVVCGTFTAASQTMSMQINQIGSGGFTRINRQSAFAGNAYIESHDDLYFPGGVYVGIGIYSSVTLAMAGLNSFDNYFTCSYVGTG
jgi:hypothetical protein